MTGRKEPVIHFRLITPLKYTPRPPPPPPPPLTSRSQCPSPSSFLPPPPPPPPSRTNHICWKLINSVLSLSQYPADSEYVRNGETGPMCSVPDQLLMYFICSNRVCTHTYGHYLNSETCEIHALRSDQCFISTEMSWTFPAAEAVCTSKEARGVPLPNQPRAVTHHTERRWSPVA